MKGKTMSKPKNSMDLSFPTVSITNYNYRWRLRTSLYLLLILHTDGRWSST